MYVLGTFGPVDAVAIVIIGDRGCNGNRAAPWRIKLSLLVERVLCYWIGDMILRNVVLACRKERIKALRS